MAGTLTRKAAKKKAQRDPFVAMWQHLARALKKAGV